MKKLYNRTLWAFALLSMSTMADAYDFEVNGIYYNKITPNICEVTAKDPVMDNTYSGSINIPSTVSYGNVTYTVKFIGQDAFSWCDAITSVNIPSTVTYIKKDAFMYCKGLTSIDIPSSVETIGDGAFYGCPFSSLTIPTSVTSIGYEAFAWCTFTSVEIPSSMTSIGDRTFYCCESLSDVTIPSSVTSIGEEAFYHCKALTAIKIPGSVESIGQGAFNDSALRSATLSEGVTTIGKDAFENCSDLSYISIPSSVTSIGEMAFAWGNRQVNFYNRSTTPQTFGYAAFSDYWQEGILHVPAGCKSIYEDAGWGNYFHEIIDDATDPTAVAGVSASAAKGSRSIYNLAGQRSGVTTRGINIINGKKCLVK